MTIGSLDEDGLSVDEQLASGNLDMAESDFLAHHFEQLAAMAELDLNSIQIRCLCRPGLGIGE